MFRRLVFDVLGGARDACPLGELFCWRPALHGPNPLLRRAPQPDSLVVCPGFGLDSYASGVRAKDGTTIIKPGFPYFF